MKKTTILSFTILCSFLILMMPLIPAVNVQNVENAIEEKIEVITKDNNLLLSLKNKLENLIKNSNPVTSLEDLIVLLFLLIFSFLYVIIAVILFNVYVLTLMIAEKLFYWFVDFIAWVDTNFPNLDRILCYSLLAFLYLLAVLLNLLPSNQLTFN